MQRDRRNGTVSDGQSRGRLDPAHARLETCPLAHDQLTRDQRNAAKQALLLLADMATLSWEPRREERKHERFLPYIDEHRWNPVVLLDGGRGSGKTTLFLSLLHAWCSTWRNRRGASASDEQLMPRHPEDGQRVLRCLVPLEILDLHPLPDATKLSLYIAERFRRVVEALLSERRSETREAPPFRPSRGEELRSDALWHKFIQAAATGWDGNLEQRKATLDPEDYAVELEQSERRRLQVSSSFYAFLDALTDEFAPLLPREEQAPLFIIPIDDADMNPQRTVELLALLRTLWHPRVAFLLTGQSELFLSTLRTYYLGVFRRNLEGLHSDDHRTLSGRADHVHLAEEVYRRVIPPGHRCELPPFLPSARLSQELRFPRHHASKDGGTVAGSTEELVSLNTYLKEKRVHPAAPTLAEYLSADNQLPEALPDRLRTLRDLLDALRHNPQMTAGQFVQRLWREAVRRATLTPEQRRALSRAIRPAAQGQGGEKEGIDVATQMLHWQPQFLVIDRFEALPPQRWNIVFRRPVRHEVSFGLRPEAGDRFGAHMTATMMLACNIAADDPNSDFVGPSPVPGGFDGAFAMVELESDRLDMSFEVSWPLPDWESFHDVALFADRWQRLLRDFPVKSHDMDPIARGFLAAILDVAERREMLPRNEGAPPPRQQPASWKEIAERLLKVAGADRSPEASDRTRIFARWALRRAVLLATPESGLSSADANAFVDAWKGTWGSQTDAGLQQERRRHLRRALQRAMGQGRGEREEVERRLDKLMEELDRLPGYRWNEIVGRPVARDPARSLIHQLDGIRVAHRTESFTRNTPLPVSGYVQGDREEAFVASAAEGQRLAAPLAEFQGGAGGASAAMAVAWSMAASTEDHALRERVRGATLGTGQLRLELDDSIVRRATTPLIEYPLREARTIRLGYVTTRVDIQSPFLNALYRVIWDVAADEQDLDHDGRAAPHALLEGAGDAEPGWWDAVQIQFKEHELTVPWLVARWPALFDWEKLDTSWQQRVSAAAAMMSRPDADRQAILDALAYEFLHMNLIVAEQRRPMEETEWSGMAPAMTEWRELVQRIRAPRRTRYTGRRWRAFDAFRRTVPLMAAPESGLSEQAAAVILAAAELGSSDCQHLQSLRRTRIRVALAAKGASAGLSPDIFLSEVDRASQPHPWAAVEREPHVNSRVE